MVKKEVVIYKCSRFDISRCFSSTFYTRTLRIGKKCNKIGFCIPKNLIKSFVFVVKYLDKKLEKVS